MERPWRSGPKKLSSPFASIRWRRWLGWKKNSILCTPGFDLFSWCHFYRYFSLSCRVRHCISKKCDAVGCYSTPTCNAQHRSASFGIFHIDRSAFDESSVLFPSALPCTSMRSNSSPSLAHVEFLRSTWASTYMLHLRFSTAKMFRTIAFTWSLLCTQTHFSSR